jgi:signal transduction histidine kinase
VAVGAGVAADQMINAHHDLEDELVYDPAVIARYHHTPRSEADRLAGLVDDLFELSRISSGTLRLDRTMCGETADLMASTPEVTRALSNVLNNAIQQPQPCGTISVEAGLAGLGLAIARGLVRARRGDISVSNVRFGCRFVVRLPSRSPPTG